MKKQDSDQGGAFSASAAGQRGLTRKPYKGDRIEMGGAMHTVLSTPEGDDNICHMIEDGKDKSTCFIWRFSDCLNRLATLVTP